MIDPENIEYDMFHDLAHAPFTPWCFGQYGGPLRHIALWWDFMFVPRFLEATKCRFGRHEMVPYWQAPDMPFEDPPTGMICDNCEGRK